MASCRQRCTISFTDLSFVVVDRATKLPRKLLADVSGTIHSGSLTAIMGASGAGKTTLVRGQEAVGCLGLVLISQAHV